VSWASPTHVSATASVVSSSEVDASSTKSASPTWQGDRKRRSQRGFEPPLLESALDRQLGADQIARDPKAAHACARASPARGSIGPRSMNLATACRFT
jgi:hypothetical protein